MRPRRLSHLPSVVLYFVLALAAVFPLWLNPAARIQSLADPLLNAWILDWVHFAIFYQIADFFQANVFWPHADALAYGEHLLAPSLLALPFRLFTDSAVAIHNLSLVEAYFFSALAAHALAFYYFRSMPAATVAGLVYGFAPYRLAQIGHVQLIHGEFLPLMFLAFEWALRSDDRRWRWLLGAAALGQWLTSWYWAVFSFWVFAPFMAMRLWHHRRQPTRQLAMSFVPLVLAALLAVPIAMPYMELSRNHAFYRPEQASAGFAARPADFVRPPARSLIYGWSNANASGGERDLFLGITAALGLVVALMLAFRRNATRADEPFPLRTFILIAALLLSFCFGSQLRLGADPDGAAVPLPYGIVERLFPFAGTMRVPARWLLPALLPLALLAAFTWQRLWMRLSHGHWRLAAIALVALPAMESLPRPLRYETVETKPADVYRWLGQQPYPSPVLELPIGSPFDNRAMLHATWHGQPTVNGSNGFFPPGHQSMLRELATFPSEASIERLGTIQVRYVIVNKEAEAFNPARMAELERLAPNARIFDFEHHLAIELN